MIPYSTQTIEEDDIKAVTSVLNSPYLTCGPKVTEFEEQVASYVGATYAVACNSCTSALHLAMLALGVKKGDLVYVSAISFVASSNCARYLDADVEFMDVNKDTGNLDLDSLEEQLKKAQNAGRLPKVVVAVHLSGRPVDLRRLKALKEMYGFYILEDAAHALGAIYDEHKIGDCFYSDITVFSFHPVKIITTGEGGMCLTNSETFYRTIRRLSSHGIVHDKEELIDKNMPNYYYEMQELGFNYRITDIQAALGVSQMAKVDTFLQKRREYARDLTELLSQDQNLVLPLPDTHDSISSWHLYQVGIPFDKRDEVYTILRKRGIGVQIHYLPIYRHPYYQTLKRYQPLPGAEEFFRKTLSLPLYPKMKRLDLQMCAATLLRLIDTER